MSVPNVMESVTSHLFGRGRASRAPRGDAGRAKAGARADRGVDAAMKFTEKIRRGEEKSAHRSISQPARYWSVRERPRREVRPRGDPAEAGKRDQGVPTVQWRAGAPPHRVPMAAAARHCTTCPQRSLRLLAFTFGNLREMGLARLNGRNGGSGGKSSESLPREFWHTTRSIPCGTA
jgi:hypothetical protein